MLLEHLVTSGFRGIKNEVELDLTAPVTLIYAPNGTGKTSICDSVEWLLTGQVSRLENVFAKSDTGGVKCIFTDRDPLIEASIRLEDKIVRLRREGVEKAGYVEREIKGLWKLESLDKVLDAITPGSLPPSANASQRVSARKSWVRAVHFLESTSLGLLVDSSQEGTETRNLVFSDLLGVGELQRDERDLERILKYLESETKIQRELRNIREQRGSLAEEIVMNEQVASAPHYEKFEAHILAAAKRLTTTLPLSNLLPAQKLASIQTILNESEELLERRRRAWTFVETHAARQQTLEAELQTSRAEQSKTAKEKEQIGADLEANLKLLAEENRGLAQTERLIAELSNVQISFLQKELETKLNEWQSLGADLSKPLDRSNLDIKQAECKIQQGRFKENGQVIELFLNKLPFWQDALAREQVAKHEIASSRLPNLAQEAELKHELKAVRANLRELEAAYQKLAGPLERLRLAAIELLQRAPDTCLCPLCQHNHSSGDSLGAAIQSGLKSMPQALAVIGTELNSKRSRVTELESRMEAWSDAQKVSMLAAEEMNKARQILLDATTQLAESGMSADVFQPAALQQELNNRRSEIQLALENLKKEESLLARARDLIELGCRVTEITNRILPISPRLSEFDVANTPPEKWNAVLAQIGESIKVGIEEHVSRRERHRTKQVERQSAVYDLNSQLATCHQKIHAILDQIGVLESERAQFAQEWSLLSKGQWSRDEMQNVTSQLDQTRARLILAKVEIQSAQTALEAASKAESTERQLRQLRREMVDLDKRTKQLKAIDQLRRDCEKGIFCIRNAKEKFIAEQVRPLCRIITAIYARAQNNGFIDKIETTAQDGPLKWLACISERQLEDTIQLSQGQRQDLALAIFLARAREMGGTFFLDEPLLHLDDLNRVGLLDVIRVIITEKRTRPLRLVITSASSALVRHFREKFNLISNSGGRTCLRIYRLTGDPRSGVTVTEDSACNSGNPKAEHGFGLHSAALAVKALSSAEAVKDRPASAGQ